jgi:hypothetical protein
MAGSSRAGQSRRGTSLDLTSCAIGTDGVGGQVLRRTIVQRRGASVVVSRSTYCYHSRLIVATGDMSVRGSDRTSRGRDRREAEPNLCVRALTRSTRALSSSPRRSCSFSSYHTSRRSSFSYEELHLPRLRRCTRCRSARFPCCRSTSQSPRCPHSLPLLPPPRPRPALTPRLGSMLTRSVFPRPLRSPTPPSLPLSLRLTRSTPPPSPRSTASPFRTRGLVVSSLTGPLGSETPTSSGCVRQDVRRGQ